MIHFDDFKKVELRVGKISSAERVEGSEKLLRLEVDIGEEKRQIVAGIGKSYDPAALLGKSIVVVVNLEPRTLMGFESQGMLLAAHDGELPVLLTTERETPPGAIIS